MTRKSPTSLGDLVEDPLNPRMITTKQKAALVKSYVDYGDLSGIVFNVRTGQIVGGHQRTNVLRKRDTKIIKKPFRDATGTVAEGYVIVPRPDGSHTRIPYREVEWSTDKQRAANIAANSAGGTFDEVKLGRVLAELNDKKYPIETIPLDSLDIKKAAKAFENEQKRKRGFDGEAAGEFESVDPKALQAEAPHTCPSCGYQWRGTTKPSFGELHRLKDDNPMKQQARELQKRVVAKRKAEAARAEKPARGRREEPAKSARGGR